MTELLRDILTSPVGSFSFIFGIICVGAWLVYFVTKHSTRYQCVSESDRTKVSQVEGNLGEIIRDIAYIKGSIDLIRTSSANSPVKSHSPISLTEVGENISKELSLDELIASNWDKIYGYLEQHLYSKNAYDIQQFCIETASVSIDDLFSAEDVDKIKNYAYRNGQSLFYYGGVIGVVIRDAYFKRKGIDVTEVDKCAPAK